MPVATPIQTVSVRELDYRGTAAVTLGLTAAPELRNTPADIVLALDRSSSMTGQHLGFMKEGANALIDLICQASGGIPGRTVAGGTRIGLVTYADSASVDIPLGTAVPDLKNRINTMTAGGTADHADAFIKAQRLLVPCSARRHVLVLFTDGSQPASGTAALLAQSCRESGTEVFCIGLGPSLPHLRQWASAPVSQHLAVTPNPIELPRLFSTLGAQIVRAGSLHGVLHETLAPDFQILRIEEPRSGTVQMTGLRTLRWCLDPIGVTGPETVRLTFIIQHTGAKGGVKSISRSARYRDQWGSRLCFPTPTVRISCSCNSIVPFPCHRWHCRNCTCPKDCSWTDPGQIIQLCLTLRNVCPGKRVALAILLTETDSCGAVCSRGMKVLTIPAHTGISCRDVVVTGIRFVVPTPRCCCASRCRTRTFQAKVLANYLDTDFTCCDGIAVL